MANQTEDLLDCGCFKVEGRNKFTGEREGIHLEVMPEQKVAALKPC